MFTVTKLETEIGDILEISGKGKRFKSESVNTSFAA
jgi:hypothetical protein